MIHHLHTNFSDFLFEWYNPKEILEDLAYQVLDVLIENNIPCFIKNIASTGSVYIKLYDNNLGLIRISDHFNKRAYNKSTFVQFNITPKSISFFRRYEHGNLVYFYGKEHLNKLVKDIKNLQNNPQKNPF